MPCDPEPWGAFGPAIYEEGERLEALNAELLAALEALLEEGMTTPAFVQAVVQARILVAKAKGETDAS